jgi:hypothetical protein
MMVFNRNLPFKILIYTLKAKFFYNYFSLICRNIQYSRKKIKTNNKSISTEAKQHYLFFGIGIVVSF